MYWNPKSRQGPNLGWLGGRGGPESSDRLNELASYAVKHGLTWEIGSHNIGKLGLGHADIPQVVIKYHARRGVLDTVCLQLWSLEEQNQCTEFKWK